MSYSKKHLTEAISIINKIDSEKIENIVKIIKKVKTHLKTLESLRLSLVSYKVL